MDLSSEEMQFLLEGYTEETVVVGTRAQPRTVAESPVPVDVLSSFDITRQGAVNLQEQLVASAMLFHSLLIFSPNHLPPDVPNHAVQASWRRCCTARSKSLTSLCRLPSHPAQYVSGIPSAAILLSISHPIRCSTRCLANVRARISGPDDRLVTIDRVLHHASLGVA